MSTDNAITPLPAEVGNSHVSPKNSTIPLRENKRENEQARVRTAAKTRDITSDFVTAASVLKTGELIKDEFFTLFEAVGALEIMDPKMDSGYLAPGDSLEDDYDVMRDLLPEEVVGIMDSILCSETAWHMGHPLSQTLFTSLYIDRILWPEPRSVDEASFHRRLVDSSSNPLLHIVLRAWCLALIKSCDFVHQRITGETFYDEEDFVPNIYNRPLLTRFDVEDILPILQSALDFVEESREQLPKGACDALVVRLQFRQSMLRVTSVEPGQVNGQYSENWDLCSRLLHETTLTHNEGQAVEGSFSVKIQRRLASTVPPRPIVNIGFDTATHFLGQMCSEGKGLEKVLECERASSIITFMQIFMSRKPQPSIYIRCLLQSIAFQELRSEAKTATREFFFNDLAELVLPAHILIDRTNAEVEPPQDDRFQIWRKMDELVDRIRDHYFDVVKALCMNRSRLRRMLCHLIIDWDNLQLDLEDLDTELRQYTHEKPLFDEPETWELPLSSWAYYHKLRQMEWIVQLGFELGIYHFDEWAGMYRYLQDLADFRHKHINRIFGYVHYHHSTASSHDAQKEATFDHSFGVLIHVAEESAASNSLAESFATLYQALTILQLLPEPPQRPYSRLPLRHALRLHPFLSICLPTLDSPSAPFEAIEGLAASLPSNPSYSSLPSAHRAALGLLDRSDAAGRLARKSWEVVTRSSAATATCLGCEDEWRKGTKEVMRAAVMAGVAGARVRKWVLDGAKAEELAVEIDDGVGDGEAKAKGGMAACWLVPKIVVPKKK